VKGFLLDTNVVSEARKGARAHPSVVRWIRAHRDRLFLSVLVTGEIRRGIETIRRRDSKAATALERWLRDVETQFEERVLPVDAMVADRWGRLAADRPVATIDGLLAATALVHGLTLATRNVDVRVTGVPCVDPSTTADAGTVARVPLP
jgi:predicted nucleic acid-binding protein